MTSRPKSYKPTRLSSEKKFSGNKAAIDLYKNQLWVNYSKEFLNHNRHCYSCGKKSEVADHLIPHKGDITLFWKSDNLIPLCHRCHNTVTTKFDRNNRSGCLSVNKLRWLFKQRIINELDQTSRAVVKVIPIPTEAGKLLLSSGR